ncbi:MAG TPA: cation:proton antiporter subunit C [Solirubrobacteraceae bacterium]|nr:cation:proton antiporter subunit C [Solirubrobacteraceae bacterium]
MSVLPYVVAVWICLAGLYGIVTSRHLLHLIISVSVLQSSTYVLLLAVGYREGGAAPIFIDIPPGTPAVDPIVQALALTDVVVGGAVTALLLAIAVQIEKHLDTLDPDELDPLRD